MIGSYLAKIKDYSLSTTKGGKPQAVIQFGFIHEGQEKTFTWFGTLAPDNDGQRKGLNITLKALYACGLTLQTAPRLSTDFFKGPESGLLDMTKELKIELQEELDENQKVRTRVQWVNDPNDSYTIKKLSAAENVQVMGGMDFTADFMKIVQDKGGQGQTGGGQNMNQGQGNNGGYQQNNQNYQQNNQGQNYNQNQGQNMNNGGQNYNQGQNMNQGQNYNQGQNNMNNGQQNMNGQGQGQGNGFKPPF